MGKIRKALCRKNDRYFKKNRTWKAIIINK